MSILSRFVPSPRVHEVDRIAVATDPSLTWTAVRAIDLYQLRFVRGLFAMRELPELARAWWRGEPAAGVPRSMHLDDIVANGSGFRRLLEIPGRAFVVGSIGKFWQPNIDFADVDPADFAAFDEPGWGKLAWSLEVNPRSGGGSWISVDLHVGATSDDAWASFTPYWLLIGRFSRLIRLGTLRVARRDLGRAPLDSKRRLPGDDILPNARVQWTHAVTVEAPIASTWPWLAQMGCRRGGWYSIDALDNGGVPSADRIVPELQTVAAGDLWPARPEGDGSFAVLAVDPGSSLVLGTPSLLPGAQKGNEPYRTTWSFVVDPVGDDATRLITRLRADYEPSPTTTLMRAFFYPAHSVMTFEQLRHIKQRAEGLAHRAS